MSRYHFNETFENETFECIQSDSATLNFDADHYVGCVFKNCIFKDSDKMNIQVTKLIQTNNKLIGCWWNPTLILTKIVNGLNEDVNFIDFFNKGLIKSASVRHKQLVLLDITEAVDTEERLEIRKVNKL